MIILFFIVLSFLIYYLLKRRNESFLASPNLKGLVFYRDFLFLTMIPYFYYFYQGRYKEHYVLSSLKSDVYFIYAAIAAMIFLVVFLGSYRIFYATFEKAFSIIVIDISYKLLLSLISLLSIFAFVIVVLASYKLNSGIFGLASGMDSQSITELRYYLSHGGGILALNKTFMKAWVPMLSYLFFYLYLVREDIFKWRHKIMMFFSFLAGSLASIFFLEKAVLFFYLFGFLGVYVYSGRRLKKHYLLVAFVISIVLVALMYLFTYGARITDFTYLQNILIHRIMTQSVGSVMSFEYFNSDNLKGLSGISNLLSGLIGESFSSVYSDIIRYYVPENADTAGAMSSFVTGDAYGLFGISGVLVSGVFVALLLSIFEASKSSTAFSIIFVGIYGLYFSHPYVASSFYSFVWPIGLIYNILPFAILFLLSLNGNKSVHDK